MLERRNRKVDLANSTEVATIASQHSQIDRGPRELEDYLLLKHAVLSRPSGQWNDDDYDVRARLRWQPSLRAGGDNEAPRKSPAGSGQAGLSNKGWGACLLPTRHHFASTGVRIRTAMRSDRDWRNMEPPRGSGSLQYGRSFLELSIYKQTNPYSLL